MFDKIKDKRTDNDRAAIPHADNGIGRVQPPPQQPAVAPPAAMPASLPVSSTATADVTSLISAGMTLVGKLVGDGAVQVFGRIEGEIQASSILICEGAQVEGNVVAKDLTIGGHVKGTIHATRVKLNGTAVVDGDIYHRSLAIEENARFEGSSRREENLTDKQSSAGASSAPPSGGNVTHVRTANPPPQAVSGDNNASVKSRLYGD